MSCTYTEEGPVLGFLLLLLHLLSLSPLVNYLEVHPYPDDAETELLILAGVVVPIKELL